MEGSLHFTASSVNPGTNRGKFQLKSGEDRRMVLTSAGKARGAVPAELRRAYLAGMTPLVPDGSGKASGNMLLL
jgi:hypothetical protein